MGTMPMGGMSYTLLKCFRDRGYVRLVLLLIVRTHAPSIPDSVRASSIRRVRVLFRLVRERVDARTGHWALAFLLSLRRPCVAFTIFKYRHAPPTNKVPPTRISLDSRAALSVWASGRGSRRCVVCMPCVRERDGWGVGRHVVVPGASARDAAAERGGRRRRGRPVVGA